MISKSGYNIKEFCKAAGISVSALYSYKSDGVDIPSEKLISMARILQVSLKEVLTLFGKDVTGVPDDQ
ncbi:helix-turn-helix domain-containing protein [Picosynechococcus sp. PCC 8807]|uniref:helix-turn-helix domain-containing protein n=1 Tax=Picosynechococcus sp. PCC 8807 TaxID=195248 RepID=UPI0030D94D80